jgi:uncharacterized protein YcbK (DUF882 family)
MTRSPRISCLYARHGVCNVHLPMTATPWRHLRTPLLLCLLVLYPSTAQPTPHLSMSISAVTVAASAITTVRPLEMRAEPVLAPTTVHLVLTRGQQRLELDLPLDGDVSPEMADDIAQIMRCAKSGRTRRIARGTLALLADVAVRFPGHEIEIISAVRAEPERTQAGVKHSKHWDGHAIDLQVRGVKQSEVRDQMWTNHHDVGVGWYPAEQFIHLDYRPDVHDMAWTQPRINAANIYHPRWSQIAREPVAELISDARDSER